MSNSPWKKFSSEQLQNYIGNKTLDELSYYLPLLRSQEFNESDLYKKNNLATIFNAFSGVDYLDKKEFRKDFFSSLDDETLKKISILFSNEENKFSRSKIIEKCSNLKWEKNQQTEKLTKLLNIDENLLPEKKDTIPEIVSDFDAVYPFKSLKEYQSTVSFKANDELQNSASRF